MQVQNLGSAGNGLSLNPEKPFLLSIRLAERI